MKNLHFIDYIERFLSQLTIFVAKCSWGGSDRVGQSKKWKELNHCLYRHWKSHSCKELISLCLCYLSFVTFHRAALYATLLNYIVYIALRQLNLNYDFPTASSSVTQQIAWKAPRHQHNRQISASRDAEATAWVMCVVIHVVGCQNVIETSGQTVNWIFW